MIKEISLVHRLALNNKIETLATFERARVTE